MNPVRAEKPFDKIQQLFRLKIPDQDLGIEENILNPNKYYLKIPRVNFVLNGKYWKYSL